MITTLQDACRAWQEAKDAETAAMAKRRQVEDTMLSLIGVPETLDGTENAEAPGGYKIKITGRMNRKVDGELLQQIAAEHGLLDHLGTLFRWKPELAIKAWKAADESITRPLLGAITTTPGRPSVQITQEKK